MANSKRHKWLLNSLCFKSPYKRWTFNKGDVIAVPCHAPNMNQNLDLTKVKGGFLHTKFGPIISKQRMCIVLWKHHECMTCLPLYSYTKCGIRAKQLRPPKEDIEEDYIEVRDVAHGNNFIQYGTKEPLEHVHWNSPNGWLDIDTVCHMTGAMNVVWQEPILHVGRLTKASYEALVKYHKALMKKAENETPEKDFPPLGVNPAISHKDY